MHSPKRFLWIVCILSCPIAAMAQDGSALSNLFRRDPGKSSEEITVDTPLTAIPSPVEVKNGTAVTVTGRKRPVDTCTITTKREELKPEPNPLGQFIKILSGLPGLASVGDRLSDCPSAVAAPDDGARKINSALDSTQRNLGNSVSEVEALKTNYKDVGLAIGAFINCRKLDDTNICSDETTFKNARDALRTDGVQPLLTKRLPVIESVELQWAAVKKLLEERLKTPNPAPSAQEQGWLDNVNTRLNCLGKHIAFLRQTLESLKASRLELEKFADLLSAHTELFRDAASLFKYEKLLPEDNNAKVSGTVACTNFFTKQVSVEAIPFTVTYQNIPRASVTAGVLFSALDKRQVGTQAVRTGTAADGTPTFRNAFAAIDRSSNQLVPFSFLNVYLTGTRQMNLNLTGGVGVNSNNGKTQAEFFVGGALGLKNVYLQFGSHIGRWQELGGGFGFGETVPANFPGVPTDRRYTMRPAIGLSYRLPLP